MEYHKCKDIPVPRKGETIYTDGYIQFEGIFQHTGDEFSQRKIQIAQLSSDRTNRSPISTFYAPKS